jgi:thioredoxin 1
MATVKLTDETFRDVIAAEKPVLVDFWAEWCGPCKQIAPALDQISEEMVDVLTVAKADIDETQELATAQGVRGVPTLMLFKGGRMVSMKVGAMPKQKIVDWLAESGVRAA